jgi:PAS domain S-box-containing protein
MNLTIEATSEALLVELFHRVEDLEGKLKEQEEKVRQQELALRVIAQLPAAELKSAADTVPLVESSTKTPPNIQTPQPRPVATSSRADLSDLYETALNAVEQALIGLDAEGQICLWNDAAMSLLGWKSSEVLGCRLPFVPLDQAEELEEYLADVKNGEMLSPWEFQLVLQSGDRRPIRLAARMSEASRLILILSPVVLHQAQPQKELKAVENRFVTIGRLIGGVAHDLNNLLSVTQGNAELLEEQLRGLPSLSRNVQDILLTSTAAIHLCRTLTGVVRPEPGLPDSCEVVSMIERMRSLLEATVGTAIRLRVTLPSNRVVVGISPGEVLQLVLNLITNARDVLLNRYGAFIEVELSECEECPKQIQLTVRDNGEGLDEVSLARLLRNSDPTELGEIAGLGLLIARSVVMKAAGTFDIQSVPGQGTTVTIRLPRV